MVTYYRGPAVQRYYNPNNPGYLAIYYFHCSLHPEDKLLIPQMRWTQFVCP